MFFNKNGLKCVIIKIFDLKDNLENGEKNKNLENEEKDKNYQNQISGKKNYFEIHKIELEFYEHFFKEKNNKLEIDFEMKNKIYEIIENLKKIKNNFVEKSFEIFFETNSNEYLSTRIRERLIDHTVNVKIDEKIFNENCYLNYIFLDL